MLYAARIKNPLPTWEVYAYNNYVCIIARINSGAAYAVTARLAKIKKDEEIGNGIQ